MQKFQNDAREELRELGVKGSAGSRLGAAKYVCPMPQSAISSFATGYSGAMEKDLLHGADKKAACQICSLGCWLGHSWRSIQQPAGDRLANIVSEEFTRCLPPTAYYRANRLTPFRLFIHDAVTI